jgi:hypothetical protein
LGSTITLKLTTTSSSTLSLSKKCKIITFYEQHKKKAKVDASDFDKICSVPKLKTIKQEIIEGFEEKKNKYPKSMDYV